MTDQNNEEALARHATTEELAGVDPLSRFAALLRSQESDHSGTSMAWSALLNVLNTDEVQFVRDDDGLLWPFVPGDGEYWRGPLRVTAEQSVEQARFYPEKEEIVWCSPWEK
jgi:hypothetical protein